MCCQSCDPFSAHVEDVLTAMFQYLAMLREEGPKEWIFQECAVRYGGGGGGGGQRVPLILKFSHYEVPHYSTN